MLKALSQELLSERLLNRDDKVVVGVSGGPDSMALLHMLRGLNEKHDWALKVHIAHLDHGLRGSEAEKDAAFVQAAAAGDESSVAVIQALVVMANRLGMQVVAEGVETEQQRDFLLGLGIHLQQGYLFARPMPARDWLGFIAQGPPWQSQIPQPRRPASTDALQPNN